MANSDKNILITPNTGSALNPTIAFTGSNASPITMSILDTGALSFSGTSGQLFSIVDSLSGSIFSVNDISGIPSLEILDTGLVKLNQYGGNTTIGVVTPYTGLVSSGAARLSISTISAGTAGLIVKGKPSQSENLVEFYRSPGADPVFKIQAGTYPVYIDNLAVGSNVYANYQIVGGVISGNMGNHLHQFNSWNAAWVTVGVRAAASQTANIQEWQNSAGTALALVNAYGGAVFVDLKINTASSLGSLGIVPGTTTQKGLVVRALASQTANLQEWQNSSGGVDTAVTSTGRLSIRTTLADAGVNVGAPSAATVGQIIRGFTSQTADLQQWQNSAGDVVAALAINTAGGSQNATLKLQGAYGGIISNGEWSISRNGGDLEMVAPTNYLVRTAYAGSFIIRGAASQTANIQEWQSSAGALLARVTSSGGTSWYGGFNQFTGDVRVGTTNYYEAELSVQTRSTAEKGIVIRALASQTANLQEWQDSAGTVITRIDSSGQNIWTYSIRPQVTPTSGSFIQLDSNQVRITQQTAGAVAFIVKGAASQTANLQEWQDSTGTVLAYVAADGGMGIPNNAALIIGTSVSTGSAGSLRFVSGTGVNYIQSGLNITGGSSAPLVIGNIYANAEWMRFDSTGTVNIAGFGASNKGLIVKGAASQTANLQEWQNSAGTVITRVRPDGQIGVGSTLITGTNFFVNNTISTTNVVATIRGAASQTANLQEWQDSAGVVLARIRNDGVVVGPELRTTNNGVMVREESSGGTLTQQRATTTPTAPGANLAKMYFRDGTNAGTLKLVVRAGASGAETTILDNIPQS